MLAVRSSATIEDGATGAAAGVFSSRREVPAADVWPAVRAVWSSALTPLAVAYARRRGDADGVATIGVIVQRFVRGERITVYTRTPAGEDAVWIQRGAELAHRARGDRDRIVQLAVAAEAAIGASATGADVELVADGDGDERPIWIVQARPIVRSPRRTREPPPPIVLAALADGRRWTWDVAHNPDPLSPAQAGLVARVADVAPWAMRVCAGYLYIAARDDATTGISGDGDPDADPDPDALEAAMAQALGDDRDAAPPISLADALARYVAFYARWAALAQYISRQPRAHGSRPSSVEATLFAAARGEISEAAAIAQLAPLSPAWDVAVPTFGERPQLVRDAIARAAAIGAGSSPSASTTPTSDPIADLAERDDHLFARAQRLVRRALLARARVLAIDPDDIFWLPLDDIAADAPALDRDSARRRAAAARAAAARAACWDMPLVVGGPIEPTREQLHGLGHGACVTGRVVRFASLASAIAVRRGDIVVTRSVTPALAVLVAGCAAIVSETGGLLDHGAALARELGCRASSVVTARGRRSATATSCESMAKRESSRRSARDRRRRGYSSSSSSK